VDEESDFVEEDLLLLLLPSSSSGVGNRNLVLFVKVYKTSVGMSVSLS